MKRTNETKDAFLDSLMKSHHEGLNGVKRVAWNIQKINRVSWKREKINRVSWIIYVQITVLFVEGLNGVKRVAWNIQKINRVPCLLHPHWDPPSCFIARFANQSKININE